MTREDGKRWMNITQACEFFGVSRRTIYLWITHGKVEVMRTPGGNQRVLVDVAAWNKDKAGE